MRRAVIAMIAVVGLAGCSPRPAATPGASTTVFDCDGFALRIARVDGAIVVGSGAGQRTLRQSRQDPLRYEGGGITAVFAPNRTFLEWTDRGSTAACIADS